MSIKDQPYHTCCTCPLCVPMKYAQKIDPVETPTNSPIVTLTGEITLSGTSLPGSFNYGWLCPLCHSVYAPSVTECHKHSISLTISNPYTSTLTVGESGSPLMSDLQGENFVTINAGDKNGKS